MSDIPLHPERIVQAHQRLDGHERRISSLERDQAVGEERFRHIQESLVHIQSSISKGVWIVLTAVLTAALALVLKVGL